MGAVSRRTSMQRSSPLDFVMALTSAIFLLWLGAPLAASLRDTLLALGTVAIA
jgi:hypothetical protein